MKTLLVCLSLLAPFAHLDQVARQAVQDSRHPVLEPVMRGATNLGRHSNVLAGLLAIAIFDARGPATVRLVLIALIPTNLVVEGLKRGTNRERPSGTHKRSNAAFPSSHAANAFALATVLAWRWKRLRWALFLLAAVVAWSRVYLDRHWVSDAVAGALIGWVVAWAVSRAYERRRAAAATAVPPPPVELAGP
jgi:undecaprenyl-diphosphatase